VLHLYKKILTIARTWEGLDIDRMQEERQYIRDEARSLFKKNKDLQTEAEVVAAITEAKSRLDFSLQLANNKS
jgi:hypothetical protein